MKPGRPTSRTLLNILFAILWTGFVTPALAQPETVISGFVVDAEDNQPIPYAHVALFDSSETNLQTGAVTDTAGYFRLVTSLEEPGVVQISSMGYEPVTRTVHPATQTDVSFGEIALPHALLNHEEVVVLGDQVRARSGADRTTYYVDENLQDVTTSGTDVLKFIPGVQVDLMQNISLQGSQEILILVDGRERNQDVMSQLNAADIERVEVINTPPAKYDADVSGVINIILKKKTEPHFSGHVHLEAPGSSDDIYLFPAYSLQYGSGKVNLFTSYSGEFSYFNIEEVSTRTLFSGPETSNWNTTQFVRQQNWSHKFYYGSDYFANDKHTLSFYGSLNPFSGELDGEVSSRHSEDGSSYSNRQENDSNLSTFHSLHYTFTPNRSAGHELSVDASLYTLDSKNSTIFSNEETGDTQVNTTKPSQQTYRFKTDYALPLTDHFKLNTGVQLRHQFLQNDEIGDFKYTNESFSAYGTLYYLSSTYDLQAGLRVERYRYGVNADTENVLFTLFPNVALSYKLPGTSQNIKLSYRRSVTYPHLYQLTPGRTFEDPYGFRTGNSDVDPSFIHNANLEYSRILENGFISATLFYNRTYDAIHSLTSITEDRLFETNSYNLGNVHRYGVRFSGNLEIQGRTGIQPYLRLFNVYTSPYEFTRDRGITSRRNFAWEAGLSAYTGFGDGFTISGVLNYASPLRRIQQVVYSDALYFISVGKTVGRGGKVEIASGLPLSKSFTYRGYEIEAPEFTTRSEGIIKLSAMPLMLKFTYRFSKGKKKDRIDHDEVTTPQAPGRGF